MNNNLLMQNKNKFEDNIEKNSEIVESYASNYPTQSVEEYKKNNSQEGNEEGNKNNEVNSTKVELKRFNIGTKIGNNEAFKFHTSKINKLCNELYIAPSVDGYFVPTGNLHNNLYQLLFDGLEETPYAFRLQYLFQKLDSLIELQETRIIQPSNNSKFTGYYLDGLFFSQKDKKFPLYKKNYFKDITKQNYLHNFFVKGNTIFNKTFQQKKQLKRKRKLLNQHLKTIKNLNNGNVNTGEIFKIANSNEKDSLTNECKEFVKTANKSMNELSKTLETLCNDLSEPVDKDYERTVNDYAVLLNKLLHTAIVGQPSAFGIKKSTKLSKFPETNYSFLENYICFYKRDTQNWVSAKSVTNIFLSVMTKHAINVQQSIKFHDFLFTLLKEQDYKTWVLLFNPYTMPLGNGNYDVFNEKFTKNPNPFKDPVPTRHRVHYNPNASYNENYGYEVTPFQFITFPYTSGDYHEDELKKREKYAGLVIADVLLPFDRSIGHSSVYWLAGDGNSGKTTYTEALKNLVGQGQTTSIDIKELDKDKFALGSIQGKYLLVGNEATDSGSLGVTKIKQIASGDEVNYEEKFKQGQSDYSTLTAIITSNGSPNLEQDGGASERRFRVLKFNTVFQNEAVSTQRISQASKKDSPDIRTYALKDDRFLSAMLNYSIDMLKENVERKGKSLSFKIPNSVKEDTREAVRNNDIVKDFAEFLGNTIEKPTPINLDHLDDVYEIYTQAMGSEKFRGSPQKFKNEIITHSSIVKTKRNEKPISVEFDGKEYELSSQCRMSKEKINNIQHQILRKLEGDIAEETANNLRKSSNKISSNSTNYNVVWIIPFDGVKEVDENHKINNSIDNSDKQLPPLDENDLPF